MRNIFWRKVIKNEFITNTKLKKDNLKGEYSITS